MVIVDSATASSPHSVMSRIDYKDGHEKAELVLELLTSTLSVPAFYTMFVATLPITRICLLLLGDTPSSYVASQVLSLIGISINASASFSRKFELISGWNVLKSVLPQRWDPSVNEAAFDILLGRTGGDRHANGRSNTTISCAYIVPTIFSALQTGLTTVGNNCHVSDEVVECKRA